MSRYCGARVLSAIRVPLRVELLSHLQTCVASSHNMAQLNMTQAGRWSYPDLCGVYTHLIAAAMPGQKVPEDVQGSRSRSTGLTSSEAFQAAEDAMNTRSGDLARRPEHKTPAPPHFRVNVTGCRCRCCWSILDPCHLDRHASPCWPRCLADIPTRSTCTIRVSEMLLR